MKIFWLKKLSGSGSTVGTLVSKNINVGRKNLSSKRSDVTSADDKALGFEYQYYFFLWKVISLQPGESVGLEELDDVHTNLNEKHKVLYQLKHTVQTKADGKPKNLSRLDIDFWKTVYNWASIITDSEENRSSKEAQHEFLKNTSFVLATNKDNQNNPILEKISEVSLGKIEVSELIAVINSAWKDCRNQTIKSYIEKLVRLDSEILQTFLQQIHVDTNLDDILEKCKLAIKGAKIDESRIDDVFRQLDSAIRQDNFLEIKKGSKVHISFESFFQKYRRYYELGRLTYRSIKPYQKTLPPNLTDQIFIQQLLDIRDFQEDDIESIANYTRERLMLLANIAEWQQRGEVTRNELLEFDQEAFTLWKNVYRRSYRQDETENGKNENAIAIIDHLREKNLKLGSQELSLEMSNGKYYELSNEPRIGWKKTWKENYKK